MSDPKYEDSTALAKKRKTDQDVEKDKKVSETNKIKISWDYIDKVRELQGLEVKTEKLRKELREQERSFPDLKLIRGGIDHVKLGNYFQVATENGKVSFAGKDLRDAADKYEKKTLQDKKNAEKQKELVRQKKQKTENS